MYKYTRIDHHRSMYISYLWESSPIFLHRTPGQLVSPIVTEIQTPHPSVRVAKPTCAFISYVGKPSHCWHCFCSFMGWWRFPLFQCLEMPNGWMGWDGMGWAGMDITWYNVITMWQAQLKTVPFSNHFSGHFTSSQVGAYPTNKSLLGMGYQLINYVCYWVYHGLPHIISVFLSNLPSFRFFQGIVGRHQQLETLLSEHRLDPMVFPEDLTMFSMPFPCLFMVFYVFFMFF